MRTFNNFISEIGIAAWNINSFKKLINSFSYNKLHDANTLNILTKNKIVCLIETHHTAKEVGDLHIEN